MKKILFLALMLTGFAFAESKAKIDLHESPFCGCCQMWVKYMENKGYTFNIHKSSDFYKIKDKLGIKEQYQSCHTGVVDGYAVEGHVPEDAVAWLLKEKPKDVIGIAVPNMPMGSPGMEQGGEEEVYDVIILLKNGKHRVYGTYKGHKLIKKG